MALPLKNLREVFLKLMVNLVAGVRSCGTDLFGGVGAMSSAPLDILWYLMA